MVMAIQRDDLNWLRWQLLHCNCNLHLWIIPCCRCIWQGTQGSARTLVANLTCLPQQRLDLRQGQLLSRRQAQQRGHAMA
jgi:hypothetical protein